MLIKILKWVGIILAGLIVFAVVLVLSLYAMGNARLTRRYSVQPEPILIPTDQASIRQGQRWATALCAHCHGADFSGKPLVDDSSVGYVPASNLTTGEGGAGDGFTDLDWVLSIRHGVDPRESRALIGMPSHNYYYMGDKDLGDMIAYLKSLPAVDHDLGEPNLSFMGKVMLAAGAFGKTALPAEVIQHTNQRPPAVESGVNAGYGEYLVRLGGCRDCHGEDLSGGKSPEPGSPLAPDLTPGAPFGQWSQQIFITAVRTMAGNGMPWDELNHLNDSDLEAIYLFLRTLPGK